MIDSAFSPPGGVRRRTLFRIELGGAYSTSSITSDVVMSMQPLIERATGQ